MPRIEAPRGPGVGFVDKDPLIDTNEALKRQIEKSLNIVVGQQHPSSGLFPAATLDNRDTDNHYQDSWVRDQAFVALALSDPLLLKTYSEGTETGKRIRTASSRLVLGMFDLFGKEPWVNSFDQEVGEGPDPFGRKHRYLTQAAPPIHFKVDGSACAWPTQNQPDSWGEFLKATAQTVDQGLVTLDKKRLGVLDKIANYIVRLDLNNGFKHSSMWEWGEVYLPASLSTLALCATGLEEIGPYLSDKTKESALVEAEKLRTAIANLYPYESTVPNDHKSRTDMATLVAFSAGALDGHSFPDYSNVADQELGNGEHPGKKRYIGDNYQASDQEAIWPMGAIMEAKVLLELAKSRGEVGLREKGLSNLRKARLVSDKFGYSPELLRVENGVLVPSKNHLLWNEALMAQACSRALVLV